MVLVLVSFLTACGSSQNKSPTTPTLNAQPITNKEIQAAKLAGPSCNYASGRSMAAVVMAMGDVEKLFGRH
jgi:predicted outer membrane protein